MTIAQVDKWLEERYNSNYELSFSRCIKDTEQTDTTALDRSIVCSLNRLVNSSPSNTMYFLNSDYLACLNKYPVVFTDKGFMPANDGENTRFTTFTFGAGKVDLAAILFFFVVLIIH